MKIYSLYILVVFFITTLSTVAQNSNQQFLEGTFGFSSTEGQGYDSFDKENKLMISPIFGKFITPNFALGGGIYYNTYGVYFNNNHNVISAGELGIVLFGRYRSFITEKLSWGASVPVALGKVGSKIYDSDPGSYFQTLFDFDYNTFCLRVSVMPEVSYFITNSAEITLQSNFISVIHVNSDDSLYFNTEFTNYSVEINPADWKMSFRYYFNQR